MSIFSTRSGKDIGIQAWGDSLTEATAGGNPFYARWPTLLGAMFKPGLAVQNMGVGGETPTQIALRQVNYIKTNTQINILWPGRNGIVYVPQDPILVPLAQMVSHVGDDRFIVLSIINRADGTEAVGSDAYNAIIAMNSQIQTLYPNNYISVIELLQSNSLRTDGLHLNAAANQIIATQIYNFIKTKNWIPSYLFTV